MSSELMPMPLSPTVTATPSGVIFASSQTRPPAGVNFIAFTPAGGRVWLEAKMTPDGVAVTVGDSGIGMSSEDIQVAMQPFGQVDNRLERRYEGTGLGLPLTRAFVELHGGSMRFDSARNQGTRITIVFPPCAAAGLTF